MTRNSFYGIQFTCSGWKQFCKVNYCYACKYTFPSTEIPERGPNCGAYSVRPATNQQIKDYERIMKEIAEGDRLAACVAE